MITSSNKSIRIQYLLRSIAWISFASVVIGWSACVHKKAGKDNTSRPPNIVWIIAEDLSPDLPAYGNDLLKTPSIDELAGRGIRYTNVFACGPACSPSRTAWATGYYQNAIGAHHMRYPDTLRPELPDGVIPIHKILQKHGYQTANIRTFPGNGKTDWLFDYDPDTYDHKQWDQLTKDQPFFARINLKLTHRDFVRDTLTPIDPNQIEIPPYYPDHPVSRADWAAYFESIQMLDKQVAQVMQDLRGNDLFDNTLIFFFSDHGRPMTRAKNTLYDSGLKVPFIVASYDQYIRKKYLGSEANRSDRLISLIDINATSLALAGVRSYSSQAVPFLGHENTEARTYVFAAADRMGETYFKSRAIRSAQFKYIRNYNRKLSINESSTAYRKAHHPIYHLLTILNEKGALNTYQAQLLDTLAYEELYDLPNDPFEVHNLAGNPAWRDTLATMQNGLEAWIQDIDDKGMYEDGEVLVRAFEAYGQQSLEKHTNRIAKLEKSVREAVDNTNP